MRFWKTLPRAESQLLAADDLQAPHTDVEDDPQARMMAIDAILKSVLDRVIATRPVDAVNSDVPIADQAGAANSKPAADSTPHGISDTPRPAPKPRPGGDGITPKPRPDAVQHAAAQSFNHAAHCEKMKQPTFKQPASEGPNATRLFLEWNGHSRVQWSADRSWSSA
jgi:hypothetical protein